MLEREIQNGLDSLEMDEHGNVDPEKAVKAYRRSAAGIDQPLPSDVRSVEALLVNKDINCTRRFVYKSNYLLFNISIPWII
jgi:hypothetical protein